MFDEFQLNLTFRQEKIYIYYSDYYYYFHCNLHAWEAAHYLYFNTTVWGLAIRENAR